MEKKGERYREMYKQIEAEEKSRLRGGSVPQPDASPGGRLGLLLWRIIIAAVLVGGFFGVRWLIDYLGTTVADKTGVR